MPVSDAIATYLTLAVSALSAPYSVAADGSLQLPEPAAQPAGACALEKPGSELEMTLPYCRTVFVDTGSPPDPRRRWGQVDCETADRHTRLGRGGDEELRANGSFQGDTAFRRIQLQDGDDAFGERCELGRNDHRSGPTALYREGQRRATYISIRLGKDFPLDVDNWQNVIQMKQTQPAEAGGGTPALSLKAFDGRWALFHSDAGPTEVDLPLWSAPARRGVWTRFAFDVVYSTQPYLGSVKLYADLNGDRDFEDAGEQSPRLITNTLKYETGVDPSDGFTAGESLPSHLRAGIYHNELIECPEPGCSLGLDNVEVLAPP